MVYELHVTRFDPYGKKGKKHVNSLKLLYIKANKDVIMCINDVGSIMNVKNN